MDLGCSLAEEGHCYIPVEVRHIFILTGKSQSNICPPVAQSVADLMEMARLRVHVRLRWVLGRLVCVISLIGHLVGNMRRMRSSVGEKEEEGEEEEGMGLVTEAVCSVHLGLTAERGSRARTKESAKIGYKCQQRGGATDLILTRRRSAYLGDEEHGTHDNQLN